MNPKYLVPSIFLLALAAFALQPQGHPQATSQDPSQVAQRPVAPANKRLAAAASHNSQPEDEGERIFQQNCSRCHTTPDGFSSRISGTVVRHMRVRASLSQHDEEELLRFFNP